MNELKLLSIEDIRKKESYKEVPISLKGKVPKGKYLCFDDSLLAYTKDAFEYVRDNYKLIYNTNDLFQVIEPNSIFDNKYATFTYKDYHYLCLGYYPPFKNEL